MDTEPEAVPSTEPSRIRRRGPIAGTRAADRTRAGSDFLQLRPAEVAPGALTDWLVAELRTAVLDARVPAGARLPPTRVLAGELGCSRGVVVQAYARLADEGLVVGRPGAGTTVTAAAGLVTHPRRAPVPPTTAEPSTTMTAPLRLPLSPESRPAGIEVDLSPGVPDLSAFPRAAWLRAERHVLTGASTADLGYGDPRGNLVLRRQLADWLTRTRGTRADAEQVLVVAGVAQALALLSQTLVRRGVTHVAVEDPGSRGARDELAHWGLQPVPVPVDACGLRVDELAATGLRAAVLTPAHQYPTGVVLAPERRRALLDWAGATDALVIEDDYDAEHRYDRAPVPALHAAAPHQVAHTGSTSKTLAPALRLGWVIPPPHLHDDLVAAKHASDLGSPVFPQLVLAHLMATGQYERHLRHVRNRQRARRDALLHALRQHLPDARIEGIAAGLHLLLTLPHLPGDVDDVALADRIAGTGVLVHPLSWHRRRPGPPGLVLGYAAHPPDQLHDAARRIATALS